MRPFLSYCAALSGLVALIQDVAAAVPSSGCKTAKYDPTAEYYAAGLWQGRQIRLVMPRRYNPRRPTPLVIAFHDRDQTPDKFMIDTQMSHQKVNEEAIVVYPTPFNVRELYHSLPCCILRLADTFECIEAELGFGCYCFENTI
jgi:poly(3-hydroxybutyrate) depolymerase